MLYFYSYVSPNFYRKFGSLYHWFNHDALLLPLFDWMRNTEHYSGYCCNWHALFVFLAPLPNFKIWTYVHTYEYITRQVGVKIVNYFSIFTSSFRILHSCQGWTCHTDSNQILEEVSFGWTFYEYESLFDHLGRSNFRAVLRT